MLNKVKDNSHLIRLIMKNMKMMAAGMCLLTVVSCQTKQGTGALIGGGGGAALGGIVGQIIGRMVRAQPLVLLLVVLLVLVLVPHRSSHGQGST